MDRFAKAHERDALRPGWKAAQVEVGRLRGWIPPTLDFQIHTVLNRVLASDQARSTSRAQVLEAHVNLAVWRDRYGRLRRRKQGG